ncbi:MAG: NAD(P)-dependent oxidoreductase [Spirochaetales bacterium]|nr:NAD(P)-dependent oxidoreductase [Spirochaetales bacterium]
MNHKTNAQGASPEQNYLCEAVPPLTIATVMEEASRCLLCIDAPCSRDCPAGTDPGSFIRSIRFKNFKGAAETIRKNNILGGICARVCPYEKLCEEACSRTGIDRPIQIGRIQRFATDYEKATGFKALEPPKQDKGKVAVIGSGPAGLSCAAGLAMLGYGVTIFEEKSYAGGVLMSGIVPSRLPKYVVEEEIKYVTDLGVVIKLNTKVGKDITLDALRKDGYKAFFLAPGNQAPQKVSVPGIDLQGVTTAVDFLVNAKPSGGKIKVGKSVVVIGGGDVAMDCATTAKLLGAEKVSVLYRRTRAEMPAYREEVDYVEDLNILFYYGFAPEEFVGSNGQVTAVKGKGFYDDSTIMLPADQVIVAVGQKPAPDLSAAAPGVKLTEKNFVVADEDKDCKTSVADIFSGGDIVNGGKTVVQAVAAGKVAAEQIDAFIRQGGK